MPPLVPCSLVVLSVPVCVVILALVAVGMKSPCEPRRKSVTFFARDWVIDQPLTKSCYKIASARAARLVLGSIWAHKHACC